jgi:hypothetical protein
MTIISFFIGIFMSSVFAQSSLPSIEPGKPVLFKWSDTHQGVLKYQPRTSPTVIIPFTVHENLCSTPAGQICKMKTQIANPWFVVVWHKHPDTSRIGQPVIYDNKPVESNDNIVISAELKKFYPLLAKKLTPAAIECDDYSWIPGAPSTKAPPNTLQIARWESEFMLPNEDTGVTENRTVGGAINVALQKDNDNSLLIKDIKALTSDLFQSPSLVVGDNFSWVLKEASGHSCQIAFKPGSLTDVEVAIDQLRANAPQPATLITYIVGTDESLNMPDGIGDSLSFWNNIQAEVLK